MKNSKDILIPVPMYLLLLLAVNTIILTGHNLDKDDPPIWQVMNMMAYCFALMYWIIFCVWFTLDILTGRNGKNLDY